MPPPDPTTDPNAPPGGIQGLLGNLFPGNNAAALYGGLLSDPATQQQLNQRALAAMAGSFAESAMPTRVPTPFGAVLGRAAAATGPAQDAVMAARLQAAQAQQEQALASLTQQQASAAGFLSGELGKWYGQGAGPTVPGTVGTPTVATVPHDAGPGWMAGWTIPPNAPTATVDPKDDGTTNLNRLAQTAIPIALPGYTVKLVSGERPGAVVGGDGGESQHAKANAADFQIFKPDGTPIDKEGPDTTGAYGKLALTMRMIAPENIKPWLGWGGNFSTRADNDVRDLMHFDFAGDRGRFGSLAQMEAQWKTAQNAPPGGAAPGAAGPQVAASSGWTTPGSWYGNSPGWTDKTDRGPQANGQPVSAGPGIALPTPRDSPQFGGWYDVTFPNGRTLRLQQTDVGPGAKGRGIDVNSVAAQQAGYTPGTFPTDAPIRVQPVTGSGAAPPIRVAANTVTGTATDAPTGLLGTAPAPTAAPAPGAPGAAPPAALPPGAPPPGAPPQAPAGSPPSLVPPPGPGVPVPPIAMPQVAAAPPQPTAPGVPAIPGAPSPERIAQAQRIAAAWAMAFPGRALPPDIEATAKFGLVGPTAQAQAAGTAAGQQPYIQQNEAQKAAVTAQWNLWVDKNKPVLTRPNTLQIDQQTGQVIGNTDAVGPDGNLHHYAYVPVPGATESKKIDMGLAQISPYAASGQKAVADKNAEDYATVTKNASAAASSLAQATNMRQEAPNFYTGPGSSYNQELNKILLAIHPDDPDRANKVASYETFMKDAGLYARQQAQAASARAGVQELKFVASSTPSEETSPRGLDRVLAQIQGISDYNLAKQQAMDAYVKQPGRGGWDNNGFEAQWNATVSPYTFMYMRYSAQDRAEIAQKLAQTKEGQAEIPRLQAQIKYITDNNLVPR